MGVAMADEVGIPSARAIESALPAVEKAVEIRRGLAAARPDAFLPDLATALSNQSLRLTELGRREDALAAIEEAVEIWRGLAAARPDAFLPDLATALSSRSAMLGGLGRGEDALAAIEEAVSLALPALERARDVVADAGMKVVQTYLRRCEEAKGDPNPDLIERIRRVLVTAGLVADEHE